MDAQFYYNRGVKKSKARDYLGAIEDYTKVIELTTSSDRRTITIKHTDGSTEYVDVFETSEGNVNAYFNRGLAYLSIHIYEMAIYDFSKVIEYTPEDAEVYFKRATAYYCLSIYYTEINNLEIASKYNNHAIDDLEIAIKLNPQYTSDMFYGQFMFEVNSYKNDKLIGTEKYSTLDEAEQNIGNSDHYNNCDYCKIVNDQSAETIEEVEMADPDGILDDNRDKDGIYKQAEQFTTTAISGFLDEVIKQASEYNIRSEDLRIIRKIYRIVSDYERHTFDWYLCFMVSESDRKGNYEYQKIQLTKDGLELTTAGGASGGEESSYSNEVYPPRNKNAALDSAYAVESFIKEFRNKLNKPKIDIDTFEH